MSYKEQRELDQLPAAIESLERQQSQLGQKLSEPGFYQSEPQEIQRVTQQMADLQSELEAAYSRWDELEARR